MIPVSDRYWLRNAHIPQPLLDQSQPTITGSTQELQFTNLEPSDFLRVDLSIDNGTIAAIAPAGQVTDDSPSVDLQNGIVFPCFVDLHTHLDKGHVWELAPNPDGTFNNAIATIQTDTRHWDADDLYRRMSFGLKCSYAHGSKAIRTHIDAAGEKAAISLGVFKTLQAEWSDRLLLQAASLVSLEYYLTPAGEQLADQLAAVGGI
ncbi:MAG TPA: hypothetical protein V6C50_13985 [Crinalium sp.]